jgi:hypothetical protein
MAQEIINIGAAANDGTGDPLRTAFDKVNNNFTQLYTTLSASGPDGAIQFKNTNTLYSTLYVGGTYLIAGAPGRIYYSNDGAVWSSANTNTEAGLYSLAYDGIDTIIAVGATGTILRSTDGGVTWTSATSGVTENLYGAVGYNGSFAVVGANGTILTSSVGGEGYTIIPTVTIAAPANAGGITATATATIANGRVSGFTITEPGLGYDTAPTVTIANPNTAGVTATATAEVGGGIVTAVNLTSGITWNEPVTGITNTLTGITHGNLNISAVATPIYVATGVTGTIVTSTDLVTWSSVSTGESNDLYAAVIDPLISKLIVVGDNGTVLTTFNASLWTNETSNVSTTLTSIAFGVVDTITDLIAVGDVGTVIRSNNGGVNWYSASSNTTGNALLGVTFVSNTANITSSSFIAVGSNATVIESNALALANAWSLQSVGSALQGDANLLYFPGTQTLSANANIVPGTDSAFSLGSPNLKFTDLYLAGNSLYLGTTLITSNANNSITFAQASNTANLTDLIGNSITVEGAEVTGNINVGDYVLANNVTTGNLVAANANFNTLTVSNIQLNGNITADYFFGNGAFLTGISGNGGSFPAGNSGAVQINYLGNFSNQGGTPNDTYSTFQFDGNGMPTIDGTNAYQQRVDYSPYLQILSPRVESEDFGIVAGPGITIVGYDDNYNTPRSAYFSVQNRSNVTQQWDFGILGNGDNNYSISDRTNGNIWSFGTDGNITLPSNTSSINYANGDPYTGGASTGNVTFDDQIVIGTGSNDGSGGLYLATGPTGAANLQYLQVRGGDNVEHIHLDTGNNAYYDQYFGDDNKYLKLEAGDVGNVVIGTDDATGNLYNWTFTSDGNLILANGNSVIKSIANSSLDPVNPNVSTMVLTPDPGYSTQSLVLDPTAPGHIHLRAPSANIDEPLANIFLGGEDSSFEVGYYNGAAPNLFIHCNTNTWTFDNTGNLNFPAGGNLNFNLGGITQVINQELNIVVQDEEDDGWSIFNTITDGLGNNLSQTQLDSGSFTIGTASGGNTYSWSFSGNTLQVSTNSQIRSFGSNIALQSMSSGSGGTASLQSISNTNDPNIFTTIDATTTGANIKVYNGGSNSGVEYSWQFANDGKLTFPGTPRIDTADDNFEVQAAESINFEANAVVNIYTDSGNNAFQWQFGDDGNLTLPDTTSVIANVSITLEANDTGNITGLNVIGDSHANLYAHGNVKIVSDSGNTTATWTFDNTGNLTLPGNLIIAGNTNIFGTNRALIQPADDLPLIALSSGANGAVSSVWVEDIGNVGNSNIAAVYANPTVGSKIVRIVVGQNGSNTGPNLWDFGTDGSLTLPGNIDMSGKWVGNIGYAVANTDAASKQYVDTLISTGISYHQPVNAASTTTLAVATTGTTAYNEPNGSGNGIGAYISTTGTFTTIDGVTINGSTSIRILVKDEANAAWNGVYNYTNATAITRTTDTDEYGIGSPTSLSINDYFFTQAGTVNAGAAFIVSAPNSAITFGTSNITFSTFSTSQVYTASTGINIAGTVISANASQTQITAVGTLGNLDVSGNINASILQNGNSNVTITANANITLTAKSNATMVISDTGANVTGTFNVSANANVGNLGTTTAIITTGNITTVNTGLVQNGNSNVSITANANVTITSNSNATMVITDTGVNVTGNITAIAATATTSSTSASVGYLGIPQQSKSANYTTVIGDIGKHIYVTATATITIDSNANVAYPIGTSIMFIANTGATATIAINSDTLTLAGTGTTGSRTLAPFGMATAVKVTNTIWFISGNGLT